MEERTNNQSRAWKATTRSVVIATTALAIQLATGCGSDTPATSSKTKTSVRPTTQSIAITEAGVPTPTNVPFTDAGDVEAYNKAYKEAYVAAYNYRGSYDPSIRSAIVDDLHKNAVISGRNAGLQAGNAAKPRKAQRLGR